MVSDARRAIAWYIDVFGAQRRGVDHVNADGTIGHAEVGNGASVEREPADQPYGRGAVIVDPFGHRWYLLRPPASATRLRQGDVANVTLTAPDAQRVRGLYATVLQVPFPPLIRGCGGPRRPRLRSVSSRRRASEERFSCRTASTISPPRSSGSRRPAAADEPSRRRFGLLAECTDDQGTTLCRWQPID